MRTRNRLARMLGLAGLLLLTAGCVHYGHQLVPGQSSESEVEAVMGPPTAVKESANGETILWFSKLPFGRENYAARVDANGTLLSFDQRLSDQYIAQIKPNVSTTDDLMEILGPPYRRFKYPLKDMEAWEYPLRTPPEPQTLYVEVSADSVVRSVYKQFDRFRPRGFMLF